MLKDGFWHEYLGEGDTVSWREYKWDELRQCFIFRSKPQY
jgi:hypothetical protein